MKNFNLLQRVVLMLSCTLVILSCSKEADHFEELSLSKTELLKKLEGIEFEIEDENLREIVGNQTAYIRSHLEGSNDIICSREDFEALTMRAIERSYDVYMQNDALRSYLSNHNYPGWVVRQESNTKFHFSKFNSFLTICTLTVSNNSGYHRLSVFSYRNLINKLYGNVPFSSTQAVSKVRFEGRDAYNNVIVKNLSGNNLLARARMEINLSPTQYAKSIEAYTQFLELDGTLITGAIGGAGLYYENSNSHLDQGYIYNYGDKWERLGVAIYYH
jgi:hypothetical protein